MAELGLPIDFDTWYAVYAPAGTPRDIVAKLNASVNRALSDAALKDRANALGIELLGSSPEQLSAHMRSEIARWTTLARAANIKAD